MSVVYSYSKIGARHIRGVTLIELMISLVLGLLVIAAAGGIFLSNKQAYNATETLGRVQENGRVAFELMARNIREAGGTPCGKNLPIANVLNNTAAFDYAWGDGIRGFGGSEAIPGLAFGSETGATTPGQRVPNTDAIQYKSAGDSGVTVSSHNPASAVIHVNTTEHGFVNGDILLICDYSQASIFQMNGANNVLHVGHNTGNSVTPGNACKALSYPVDPSCSTKPKDGKKYTDNAIIAKYNSAIWYIGYNGRSDSQGVKERSLYHKVLTNTPQEMTEGVSGMTLFYLVPGKTAYEAASAGVDWKNVNAVRIELQLQAASGTLRGGEIAGTDGNAIGRRIEHIVTLRNRMP